MLSVKKIPRRKGGVFFYVFKVIPKLFGTEVDGRNIVVNESRPKAEGGGGGGFKKRSFGGGGNGGGGGFRKGGSGGGYNKGGGGGYRDRGGYGNDY